MELDKWQRDVLATEGNLVLRSGRQVGKSTIIALKAAQFALKSPKKTIMVIAFVEKQANLIFSKILNNLMLIAPKKIKKGRDKKTKQLMSPTKHIINLTNGTVIYCYAAGETGYGIMGYTIDLLIADEAAFIAEEVWNSVTPALAVTNGVIWLLSTPRLKEGYYYKCFTDPSFTSFHQSSEDCPRIPQPFLEQKRKEFSKCQYAQMYLGEWLDEYNRLFSDEWIDKVCIIKETPSLEGAKSLGVDIAGMGDDESAFEGFVRNGGIVQQFLNESTTKTSPVETENKIKDLNIKYDFETIGIDDGGMGVGVLAHLLIHDPTKQKVIGLNNARRVIDSDERTSKLQKEAMYVNMLMMGEQGELQLLDDDEVKASLRSMQAEDTPQGLKIAGTDDHKSEGLVRGVYLLKEKDINIKVYSIPV